MKTTCPHCNTVHDADDATAQPSRLAVMILITVIGVAGGWTTGFFCGGILTKPNRQKVNAEIEAIRSEARNKIGAAQRIAIASDRDLQAQIQANHDLRDETVRYAKMTIALETKLQRYQKPLTHGLPLLEGHDTPKGFEFRDLKLVPNTADTFYVAGEIRNTRVRSLPQGDFTFAIYHHDKSVLTVCDVYLSFMELNSWRAFKTLVADVQIHQVGSVAIHRTSY